ncbi:MAG: malate/lactate/ureidoglycolate dehydrogenase [Burkholderiaceae bacterium]|jgi:uncharacterized oxidoreductase
MPIIQKVALEPAIAAIFLQAGTPADTARLVAENLVEANLFGHDSHGVGMVERYIESLQTGGLVPHADATPVIANDHLTVFDGNRGFGQRAGRTAVDHLAEKAKAHGVGAIGLRNCHHLGRIGAFSERLANEGLVSVMFVNVRSTIIVAPWGGREGRFGTNPISIGVPRPSAPHFILDFATSMIAMGKARVAWLNGKKLNQKAVIDAAGEETSDPRPLYEEPIGALLPFGGHKGSGLAFACSLLTGVMIGSGTEKDPIEFDRAIINGMFAIAVDPQASGAASHWRAEVDDYIEWVLAAKRKDPGTEVLAPGEPEYRTSQARSADGIDVDVGTYESLARAAKNVGLQAGFIPKAFGLEG